MRVALVRAGLVTGAFLMAAAVVGLSAQDKAKVDAAAIYKTRCSMCHGPKGDSTLPGMSFADGVWKHGNSVKEISTIIHDGVEGTAMLPMKGKLNDAEIDALAEFVRAFDPKLKPAAGK